MKYKVSSAAKPAPKKPFDFAAAYESLQQSFESAVESYNEMVAAEGRVAEIEDCLRDGQTALASIKKYGVTPANMAIVNADNVLDEALGLEKLDLTAIESLSESTAKVLAGNYVKGLEGLDMENVKAFLARLKEFFLKIINWLKDRFFGTAKLVKILKEEKFEGEFDGEVQMTGLEKGDVENCLNALKGLAEHLKKIEGDPVGSVGAVEQILSEKYPEIKKTTDTVSKLGYTKDNIAGVRDTFVSVATTTIAGMDESWKAIQANYKKFESEAKGEDEGIKDKVTAWFKGLRAASKCLGQCNKIAQACGMSILQAKKAFKKAPAPAPAE